MSLNFVTIPQKNLSQSISSSASTFKLNNIKSFALNSLGQYINLTSSDFGSQAFGVFRNDTGTLIELFEFDPTTIASSSITILRRGLSFDGDLTTETSTYKLDWPAGTIVMLGTDAPQLFQWLKEYIDAVVLAGGLDASTTVKGIVEEATQAEVDAGTATGGTGARLFVNPSTILNASTTVKGLVEEATDAEVVAKTDTGGSGAKLFVTPSRVGPKFSTSTIFASAAAPTSWTDLDLSSIVGTTQRIVMLQVDNDNSGSNITYAFRTNGDTREYHHNTGDRSLTCMFLTTNHSGITIVKTDTSGVIEWICSGTYTTIIKVISYW